MSFKSDKKIAAVVLAAGSGTRMGKTCTKQLMMLCGETVIRRCVKAFDNCDSISQIVIVCKDDELDVMKEELGSGFLKPMIFVRGGDTRAESAERGFRAAVGCDYIAIHDAARCLITAEDIKAVINAALLFGAATAAYPATDTLKSVDENGVVTGTIPRNGIYCAQTPQVFSYELYERAIELTKYSHCEITDDNMLAELMGVPIKAVVLGKENIKITTAFDLELAEFILRKREDMNVFRIGHGYDVHRLTVDRKLIIGGVEIPCDKGLLGHSDADVLTHAVMDALLGAASLGDIGRHFPDTSDAFCGISSLVLLSKVDGMLKELGYSIENIDVTLILQKPKIAPYIEAMIEKLSETLGLENGRINIKATTEEKLGFTGREEGVAAHAVAMIKK